jgi:hypothetical protein
VPEIFKAVLRYYDNDSGLSWSIANWRYDDDASAVKAAALAWHQKYMDVCGNTVYCQDLRVYPESIYYGVQVFDGFLLTPDHGQGEDYPTEISTYMMVRAVGDGETLGTNAFWKLHGIDQSLVTDSREFPLNAKIVALRTASLAYFRIYRPKATHFLPIINPPVAPAFIHIPPQLYNRRLGRSFLSIGQHRRYTRTAPASP